MYVITYWSIKQNFRVPGRTSCCSLLPSQAAAALRVASTRLATSGEVAAGLEPAQDGRCSQAYQQPLTKPPWPGLAVVQVLCACS
jgi:hypothetical protein